MSILTIENVKTEFKTYAGRVMALNGISIDVAEGEVMGIVGESGSGKSVTMLSVLKLLSDNGRMVEGKVTFQGRDITNYSKKQMQSVRGGEIGMIFQDPLTSLNPVFTIGSQLYEQLFAHKKVKTKEEAKKRAIELLNLVGIPEPERRLKQYPHEFSGGMRQRVMIAMALSCSPKLLIADEPTTALDVTIQAQIIELLKELRKKLNMAIILITHDLGLVADICDRITVMYGGIVCEQGTVDQIFYNPSHEYTKGLLKCIPKTDSDRTEKLVPIEGHPPNMLIPQKGCPFLDRCDRAMNACRTMPDRTTVEAGHITYCWEYVRRCSNESGEQKNG